MYTFTKSVIINRSQQDVFEFLRDPANMSKWQPVIEAAEWTTESAPGVGSTYKAIVRMPGNKSEAVFEITHWDPPNGYGYKSVKVALPGKIKSSIRLAPKGTSTQLTFEAQIETSGIFKIVEGLLGKQAEKGDGNSIETLKQVLEAA